MSGDTATVSAANSLGEITVSGDLLRWKVFQIAGDDHVRSCNQCRGNNVFVIDIGEPKRAI
jgi:hypothetical protein